MCSRKDYVAVAACIQAAQVDVVNKEPKKSHRDMLDGVSLAAEHIADYFAADNARFDRERFLAACGVQS